MNASARKTIATRRTLELVNELRAFAKIAEVRDLQRIADVAEEIAIEAEEAQEDRLAAEAMARWNPLKGDVIEFVRETDSDWRDAGHVVKTLSATVLKTPTLGSRRICVAGLTRNGKSHIMIKRVIGIVSRAPKRGRGAK